MRLLSEVKMWRDGVFKKMDEQVSRQQERHRAQNALPRLPAFGTAFRPQSDHFRDDFDENRRQHEARAERHEIRQEVTAPLKSAGAGQQKPAPYVGQRHEAAEEEKFAETHPQNLRPPTTPVLNIYILAGQYTG
ncbi:MAG TPA: hypothetical protein VF736_10575 [Pyrinomonadaceae bacterium]